MSVEYESVSIIQEYLQVLMWWEMTHWITLYEIYDIRYERGILLLIEPISWWGVRNDRSKISASPTNSISEMRISYLHRESQFQYFVRVHSSSLMVMWLHLQDLLLHMILSVARRYSHEYSWRIYSSNHETLVLQYLMKRGEWLM